MITDPWVKFGPGIMCFQYGTGGAYVNYQDGTSRRMTEQELQWMWDPLTDDLKELEDLNAAEAGTPLCDRCDRFHPVLAKAPVMTAYADQEQPQPILCPQCREEWVEYWNDMWDEYRSSQGF